MCIYIKMLYICEYISIYCVYKRTQTSLFSTTCVWVDTADESLPSERTTHTFPTPSSFEHHGKLVRSLNHTVAGIAARWNCWHLSRISKNKVCKRKNAVSLFWCEVYHKSRSRRFLHIDFHDFWRYPSAPSPCEFCILCDC